MGNAKTDALQNVNAAVDSARKEIATEKGNIATIEKERTKANVSFDTRSKTASARIAEIQNSLSKIGAEFSGENKTTKINPAKLTVNQHAKDTPRDDLGVVTLDSHPEIPVDQKRNPTGALSAGIIMALIGTSKNKRRSLSNVARAIPLLGSFRFKIDKITKVANYSGVTSLVNSMHNDSSVTTWEQLREDGLVNWEETSQSKIYLTAAGRKAAEASIKLNS